MDRGGSKRILKESAEKGQSNRGCMELKKRPDRIESKLYLQY
jgi:hypothetical protein